MNINKYTEKAREAVAAAVELAQTANNPQVEPEHLLAALVDQREGIIPELLRKMNVDPAVVSRGVKDLVAKTGHGATSASQQDAVKSADIVVIAVPGTAAGDVVKQLGDLSGKIILDPTNLANRNTPDGNVDYAKPAGANSNACAGSSG